MLTLLEQLGMLQPLNTPGVDFLQAILLQHGMPKDMVLSFDEFRELYNAAKVRATSLEMPLPAPPNAMMCVPHIDS